MASKIVTIARVLLGLAFFVFGLNGFLHFIPQPPMSGPPADFVGAMIATGYLWSFVKGTEVVAGALLLSGRFVPLALTVLAPVMLNILAFHVFLAPAGLPVPIVLLALELFLAWSYRSTFRPILRASVSPDASSEAIGLHSADAH
ncbi:MAG: DoxX family membrane protein [Polyangiaceae bacterium]|jgi:uncharacterized membrane protein YphA (DoxX/SURF4 family)